MTYEDTNNVISSPESADGASRCGSPDGPITDLFGLEVVHASHSQVLETKKEKPTNGTFFPSGSV